MIRTQGSSLFARRHSFAFYQKARPSVSRHAVSLLSTATRARVDGVKSFDQIPGPGIFENISTFIRKGGVKNLYEIHREQFEKFGPIFKTEMFGKNLVYIADAESNAQVYRAETSFPIRGFVDFETTENTEVYSLVGDDYKRWNAARSPIASTILRPVEVQKFAPGINDVAKDAVSRLRREIKDGRIANIKYEIDGFTAENIIGLVFGVRGGFYDDPQNPSMVDFIRANHQFMDVLVRLGMGPPLWQYVTTPAYRKLKGVEKTLYRLANEFVEMRKTKWQQQQESELDISLYGQMTADKSKVNDKINHLAIALSQTGVETTGNAFLWCLYHLSRNPKAQQKAYQEILSVNGECVEAPLLYSRLPYLKACIKESSRLMPVVPLLTRKLEKDTILNGYNIPANSVICMWIRNSGNSAKNFNKPEEFDPQRWIRGKRQEKVHPYAHLPFGFGVRMCLGRRLADLELTIGLAHVMQNFRLEYVGEDSVKATFMSFLNFPEKELPIKYIERH